MNAWNKVFYISTAITWFATVFYFIFASGVVQPWASEEGTEEKETTTIEISASVSQGKRSKHKVEDIEMDQERF